MLSGSFTRKSGKLFQRMSSSAPTDTPFSQLGRKRKYQRSPAEINSVAPEQMEFGDNKQYLQN
jgi:hypothetical protein